MQKKEWVNSLHKKHLKQFEDTFNKKFQDVLKEYSLGELSKEAEAVARLICLRMFREGAVLAMSHLSEIMDARMKEKQNESR